MTDKRKDKPKDKHKDNDTGDDPSAHSERGVVSLLDGLIKRAGKVAGGTLDMAMDVATMSAMYGDGWIRDLLANSASPERLEAMAEAGHFLRDARETAGLSLRELSESLDLGDDSVLGDVERGEAILPLELMLRTASLLARHDPIPFLIRFLRSYNPRLEATLEQWGVMALPRNYERERRFINLYRQHDFLRELDDDAYQRFIEYMDGSTRLVVEVMEREGAIGRSRTPRKTAAKKSAAPKSTTKKSPVRKKTPRRASAPSTDRDNDDAASRPVVRKVKPRNAPKS